MTPGNKRIKNKNKDYAPGETFDEWLYRILLKFDETIHTLVVYGKKQPELRTKYPLGRESVNSNLIGRLFFILTSNARCYLLS